MGVGESVCVQKVCQNLKKISKRDIIIVNSFSSVYQKMKIREKTQEELQEDRNMVKKDISMHIIKGRLYDNLSSKKYVEFLRKSKKLNKQRDIFEKEWTLALRITGQKVRAHSNSLDKDHFFPRVVVEFSDYKKYLHFHKKLEKWEIKNLKLFIESNEGSSELDIPDADKNGLLKYLVDGEPPIDFDCQSFIHQMKNVKMRSHTENYAIIANKWLMEQCDIEHLKPWACICMFKNFSDNYRTYNGVSHFAYYLWKWLFISKLWMWGYVAINTIEELNKLYSTKEFVQMIPNPNHEDVKIHNPQK